MKIVLSRGRCPDFSQNFECRITAQEVFCPTAEQNVLQFSLDAIGQVLAKFQGHGESVDYQVEALSKLWFVTLADSARVWFASLPWGELPDLAVLLASPVQENFYIPWRGWRDSVWFDGPLLWVRDGTLQRAVLPGAPAELQTNELLSNHDGAIEWYRRRAVRGWKQSLAWAFREILTLDANCSYKVQLPADPVLAMITLLGLRLAYPASSFYWMDRPTEYAPQWKRLAQNLNIEVAAPGSSLFNLQDLNVTACCELWSIELCQGFLLNLQSWVPLIPGRLVELLKSG